MFGVKSIVSRVMGHYKSILGKRDTQLDSLRFQLLELQRTNEGVKAELECQKKETSRLAQEVYEKQNKLAMYDEMACKMDFYNQLREEVLILRQKTVGLESERDEAVGKLCRKQELFDFLERSNADGKIDFRKLEQNFLLLKKENSALKAKAQQQSALVANLKQEEARLKNKIKALWKCPVPGGLESLVDPD